MPWKNGHYQVNHPREPWGAAEPEILVHAKLEVLRGRKMTGARRQYSKAKFTLDMGCAEEVMKRCLAKPTTAAIIAHTIAGNIGARIILPHPAFDDEDGDKHISATERPRNAIPFVYAAFLSNTTGGEIDEEIVQIARVGRTTMPRLCRFLYQPTFGGAVRRDQSYIIADDVVSSGGTFAALRSHILRNGGRVAFSTALASTKGENHAFCITEQSVNQLQLLFGESFNEFWTETIGHGMHCLTEAEAKILAELSNVLKNQGCREGDAMLQRLRDCLDEAAAKDW
jgi:hypothetical protein